MRGNYQQFAESVNSERAEDEAKLAELMTLEKQMREGENSRARSESPDQTALERQVNFIFRAINAVSAVVGLTFCLVGTILFYSRRSASHFGSIGYVLVSIDLGLDGFSLTLVAFLGLLFSVRSRLQMFLYAAGGALLFCVMLVSSIIRLPGAPQLFGSVSMEMSQSLLAGKNGNPIELAKWDDLQTTFHCCGMSNFEDWCNARNLSQVLNDDDRVCNIPKSCFSKDTYGMPATIEKDIDPTTPVFGLGCYKLKMQSLLMEISLLKSFVYVMLIFLIFDVLFAGFILYCTGMSTRETPE